MPDMNDPFSSPDFDPYAHAVQQELDGLIANAGVNEFDAPDVGDHHFILHMGEADDIGLYQLCEVLAELQEKGIVPLPKEMRGSERAPADWFLLLTDKLTLTHSENKLDGFTFPNHPALAIGPLSIDTQEGHIRAQIAHEFTNLRLIEKMQLIVDAVRALDTDDAFVAIDEDTKAEHRIAAGTARAHSPEQVEEAKDRLGKFFAHHLPQGQVWVTYSDETNYVGLKDEEWASPRFKVLMKMPRKDIADLARVYDIFGAVMPGEGVGSDLIWSQQHKFVGDDVIGAVWIEAEPHRLLRYFEGLSEDASPPLETADSSVFLDASAEPMDLPAEQKIELLMEQTLQDAGIPELNAIDIGEGSIAFTFDGFGRDQVSDALRLLRRLDAMGLVEGRTDEDRKFGALLAHDVYDGLTRPFVETTRLTHDLRGEVNVDITGYRRQVKIGNVFFGVDGHGELTLAVDHELTQEHLAAALEHHIFAALNGQEVILLNEEGEKAEPDFMEAPDIDETGKKTVRSKIVGMYLTPEQRRGAVAHLRALAEPHLEGGTIEAEFRVTDDDGAIVKGDKRDMLEAGQLFEPHVRAVLRHEDQEPLVEVLRRLHEIYGDGEVAHTFDYPDTGLVEMELKVPYRPDLLREHAAREGGKGESWKDMTERMKREAAQEKREGWSH